MGSSPLARGLLFTTFYPSPTPRIIPARAGFTVGGDGVGGVGGDHPRSRGVYRTAAGSSALAVGSSPLARGLRGRGNTPRAITRIIPARAGFTCVVRIGVRGVKDHPRSRGVYLKIASGFVQILGSSPLARGLPSVPSSRFTVRGIIPARAGFTTGSSAEMLPNGDHPRSRGVYRVTNSFPHGSIGSSPLARGLLVDDLVVDRKVRIIPARAGFTPDQ